MSSQAIFVQLPDEIGEPTRAVVELFRESLRDLSFPDVNHERLEALVEMVRGASDAVEAARAALQEAQGQLDEAMSQLSDRARRGHAYARVFAQGDESLTSALDAIPVAPKADRRRRRGEEGPRRRKTKKKASGPELPLPNDEEASDTDLH